MTEPGYPSALTAKTWSFQGSLFKEKDIMSQCCTDNSSTCIQRSVNVTKEMAPKYIEKQLQQKITLHLSYGYIS